MFSGPHKQTTKNISIKTLFNPRKEVFIRRKRRWSSMGNLHPNLDLIDNLDRQI